MGGMPVAVMIIGAGLDKTGLMGKVAWFILKVAARTEARIIPAICSTVGFRQPRLVRGCGAQYDR